MARTLRWQTLDLDALTDDEDAVLFADPELDELIRVASTRGLGAMHVGTTKKKRSTRSTEAAAKPRRPLQVRDEPRKLAPIPTVRAEPPPHVPPFPSFPGEPYDGAADGYVDFRSRWRSWGAIYLANDRTTGMYYCLVELRELAIEYLCAVNRWAAVGEVEDAW